MRRALLLLVLLTIPVDAAPQLKDRKPAPDPEEARIAALRTKYAAVRMSGQPADNRDLDLSSVKLQVILLTLDDLDRQQITAEARKARELELEREARSEPVLGDLYDIAMYDQKKAAGGK
jgi:hypothetical protein